jgi:hypothetical protein
VKRLGESWRQWNTRAMAAGRLIRVRCCHDPAPTVYVVAEADCAAAIEILEKVFATAGADYEDLGRINDSLVDALRLKLGQFSRLL